MRNLSTLRRNQAAPGAPDFGSGLPGADRGASIGHLMDLPEQGVSQDRVLALAKTVRQLSMLEADKFRMPAKGGDPHARRVLRYLACLLPEDTPPERISVAIHEIVNNDQLSVQDVRRIVDLPFKGVSGLDLHDVACRVKRGEPRRQVVKDTSVSRITVDRVLSFLGAADARREHEEDLTIQALENPPVDVDEFADEIGYQRRTAKKRLRDMCDALGYDYEARVA